MKLHSIKQLPNVLKNQLPASGAAVAAIFCVDNVLIDKTVSYYLKRGFDKVILFVSNPDQMVDHQRVLNVSQPVKTYQQIWEIMPKFLHALDGHWLYYGFNAEFLYYPYCESRSIKDLTTFLTEERRSNIFGFVLDLYSPETETSSTGSSMVSTYFDAINYHSMPNSEEDLPFQSDNERDRTPKIFGGLRWRFEEHLTNNSRRIDCVRLFLVTPDLNFDAEGKTDRKEFYTSRCEYHYSPTVAICSFRMEMDIKHNPNTRNAINSFVWSGSERFRWNSPQLLRLGIIEPGQWF